MITKVGETSDIVHVTVQRAAGHFEELWLEVKKLHEIKLKDSGFRVAI